MRGKLGSCEGPNKLLIAGSFGIVPHVLCISAPCRAGPRKKRTLYIADAKQATGHLITEIQIGQRMRHHREQRQICTGNGGSGTPTSAVVC